MPPPRTSPDYEAWLKAIKGIVGLKVSVTAGSHEEPRKGICVAIHPSGLAVVIKKRNKKLSIIRLRAIDEE